MCLSATGTWLGFIRAQIMRKPENSEASNRPGSTPATNRWAIDTSAATP